MLERVVSMLPYALVLGVVATSLVVLANTLYQRLWTGRKTKIEENRPATQEEIEALAYSMAQEMEAKVPKCPCGNVATHPSPQLVRSRDGWLRAFFGVAPLYRRRVPKLTDYTERVFCETHAHVADSMMDRFIYERVRAVLAEANEKISIEAAAFESENLISQIKDVITSPKKKKNEGESIRPPIQLLAGGTK